MAKILKFRRKK